MKTILSFSISGNAKKAKESLYNAEQEVINYV